MSRIISDLARPILGAAVVLLLGLPALGRGDDASPTPSPDTMKRRVVVVGSPDGEEGDRMWVGEGGPMRFKMEEPFGKGYLGVGLIDLTTELREHFGVPSDAGVMVSHVEADSPAAKAGIKAGDVITGLDGKDVTGSFDVMRAVRSKKDGDTVAVELFRDGKVQKLTVTAVEKERRMVEIGGLPRQSMNGLSPKERAEIDEAMRRSGAAVDEAMRAVGQRMRDIDMPALRDKVMVMRTAREAELEKRLAELEKRLTDLQKQIDNKNR